MKKFIVLLATCAIGAFAMGNDTLTEDIRDEEGNAVGTRTYEYDIPNGQGEVSLVSIDPPIEGATLDLAAVQKRFSEEDEPLKIVRIDEVAKLVTNPDEVTSVVLPEYFKDVNVRTLRDDLDNLESFSGGGTLMTDGGLVYADGGRSFVACPKAWSGAVKLRSDCREIQTTAFYGCRNLTGVSGGAEVMRVKFNAFGDLLDQDGLPPFIANAADGIVMVGRTVIGWKGAAVPATITLPNGATSIAQSAFPETVVRVEGGSGIDWVGQDALPGLVAASPEGELVMVGRVLMGCNGAITEFKPPADTVAIAPKAFDGKAFPADYWIYIKDLSMLETIGDMAFRSCSGLTRVTLPDSVREIGKEAFANCNSLLEFTFGQATETLGKALFWKCSSLEDVYFRSENAPTVDSPNEFYRATTDGLVTHVRIDSAGWELEDGKWCGKAIEFDQKRDAVTGYVGYYGKWTLAKLGVPVPPAGTVYSAVAYGLPKGLVLKANAAVKKKGKVVIPAKTSWWIEGVPSTTLNRFEQTAFVRTTVNGVSTLHPLDLEVVEQTVLDYDFNLNEFVVKKPGGYGTDKGWTLSGLPKGLKQTLKATKVKVGRVTYSVPAYSIYGTPTVPGNYIVTAKTKTRSWYEVRKYRYRVLQADGTPVEDELPSRPTVGLDLYGYDGTKRLDGTKPLNIQGGLRSFDGAAVIKEFKAPVGATLTLTGAPTTYRLEEGPSDGDMTTWKLVGFAPPGDYHVGVVATMDGFDDARQTVLVHSEALPDWATGTFSGYVAGTGEEETLWGYFTATVNAKGTISGKLDRDGENYVFTADAYTLSDETSFGVSNVVLKLSTTKKVYDRKKKKWVTVNVLEEEEDPHYIDFTVERGVSGVLTGRMYSEEDLDCADTIVAQQNRWGNTYKSIGAGLFTASAKQKYRTYKVTSGYDLPEGASLSFKITPSGAVTVTGSFPDGWKTVTINGRKKRVRAYKQVVRSTMLIPETHPDAGAVGFRGRIAVYLPEAYKVDGRSRDFTHMFEFPFETEGKTWYTGEFNTPAFVALPSASAVVGSQNSFVCTYGTCNIKVKDSLAFTGTFTPAGIGQAVSFSGTLKLVKEDSQGAAPAILERYEAKSTIIWNGWMIPFDISVEKDSFENLEVGRIRFGGESASGAVFASYDAGNTVGGSAATQDFWRRLSPHPYDESLWTVFGEVFWPDLALWPEDAVFDPAVDFPSAANGDWLVYRYRSSGRVSIDGIVNGYEVKTSSVVQFIEQTDTGYKGCFFVNLPIGLFAQKCLVKFPDSGEEPDVVTTEGEPLKCVWAPDYE